MLNTAHMLEIAMLLLIAFLIGATIGTVASLAVRRLTRSRQAAPAVVGPVVTESAAVVEPATSLVTAPVIEPVNKAEAPVAPAEVPAMDFTEVLLALAGDKPGARSPINLPSIAPADKVEAPNTSAEMAPARVAGATTSGRLVAHPGQAAEPVRTRFTSGASADVIPFPVGRPVVTAEQPIPAISEPNLAEPPVEETPVAAKAEVADAAEPDSVAVEAVTSPSPALEETPRVVVEPEPPVVEPVAVPSSSRAEDDEAAAMRAIEGNWTPRRGAPTRARKVALPESEADEAVAASGAAVAAAVQAAAEAVAEQPVEAPGKPEGIAAPRHGLKDDLTHVIGILPIIETALNRLGLYHFDQIAELTDENAGWIEAHLGIEGRIGREHWREQARGLMSTEETSKKVVGKP